MTLTLYNVLKRHLATWQKLTEVYLLGWHDEFSDLVHGHGGLQITVYLQSSLGRSPSQEDTLRVKIGKSQDLIARRFVIAIIVFLRCFHRLSWL